MSTMIYTIREINWRLPVEVTIYDHEMLKVQHAPIQLLKAQRKAIENVMSGVASLNSEAWYVQTKVFDKIAEPWEGDPEDAVVWNIPDKRTRSRIDRSQDWTEFRESLVASGWFKTSLEAELVLHVICEAAMNRLINECKPVDLGFCVLHPSPRRRDFPTVVKRYVPTKVKKGEKIANLSGEEQRRALRVMCDNDVTAEFRGRLFWTIEVILKRSWVNSISLRERLVLEKLKGRYPAYVSNCLKATLRAAIDIFDAQRTEKNLKTFCIAEKRKDGGRYKPIFGPKKKRTFHNDQSIPDPSAPSPYPPPPVVSPNGSMAGQAQEGMSSVRDLPPADDDLRTPQWVNLV